MGPPGRAGMNWIQWERGTWEHTCQCCVHICRGLLPVRHNKVPPSLAPPSRYKKADVVAVALRKFGSVAALAADRAAAHARLAKEREKRQSGEEARWWAFPPGRPGLPAFSACLLWRADVPTCLPAGLPACMPASLSACEPVCRPAGSSVCCLAPAGSAARCPNLCPLSCLVALMPAGGSLWMGFGQRGCMCGTSSRSATCHAGCPAGCASTGQASEISSRQGGRVSGSLQCVRMCAAQQCARQCCSCPVLLACPAPTPAPSLPPLQHNKGSSGRLVALVKQSRRN